jgi:hypothetical protein
MAITTTSGAQIRPTESVHSVETMTQSTATAAQEISTTHQVTTLGGGTATGSLSFNQYLLATGDGWELMDKIVQMGATGEATLQFSGTATGAHVMAADTDFVHLKQIAGTWWLQNSQGATLATAT